MNLNPRRFALVCLCLTVLLAAPSAIAAGKGDKYCLITHGSADYYWHALFNGAKAASKNLGVELQILSPAGAEDTAYQVRLFEQALATRPAGIASTCPSDTAFSQVLRRARDQGVPVVLIDTKPGSATNNPFLAFIGSDNVGMGEAEARKAVAMGEVSKRVLIANPQGGNIGLEQRAAGIKGVLNREGITVDEMIVGTDPSNVQLLVKAYLAKHPETSAVFCLTSQSLIPIGQLFIQSGHSSNKQVSLFSFDNTPETAQLIQKGIVTLTVNQQPYLMGYFAVTELVLKNRYGLEPVNIDTGYGFVSRDNVEQVLTFIEQGVR